MLIWVCTISYSLGVSSAASPSSVLSLWLFMSFPHIKCSNDFPWMKFKYLQIEHDDSLGLGYLLNFIFYNSLNRKLLIYHTGLNFRMIRYNWLYIWLLEMLKIDGPTCGPNPDKHLLLQIKSYWNIATPLNLHIIYGASHYKAELTIWPPKPTIVTLWSDIEKASLTQV